MHLEETGMLTLFDMSEKRVYEVECSAIQLFKIELSHISHGRWVSGIQQRAKNHISDVYHEQSCHSLSLVIYVSHHGMKLVDALVPNITQRVDIALVRIKERIRREAHGLVNTSAPLI